MGDFLGQLANNSLSIVGGALAGAALVGGMFAFREWPRWRYRRQRQRRIDQGDLTALNEPEETTEYLPHALTDEERSKFPLNVATGAFAGAMMVVLFTVDHPLAKFLAGAFGFLTGAITLLFARSDERSDSQRSPEELAHRRLARWKDFGFLLLGLAFVALTVLGLPTPVADWVESLGLTPRDWFNGFWLLAMTVMAVVWYRRFQSGPPEFLNEDDLDEWNRETALMLMAAIAIALIAMLAMFA